MDLDTIEFGDVTVDLHLRQVHGRGDVLRLTPLEHRLLVYLHDNAGRLVTQSELLEQVWKVRPDTRTATVYATVKRLRKKVEPDPRRPRFILNHPGVGYRLRLSDDGVFGRSTLLAELRATLQQGGLAVLHGPGGIGKSHLARAWMEGDGTWVSLRSVTSVRDVVSSVANAVGCDLSEPDVDAQLQRVLRNRRLVLDDLDAVPQLDDLLAHWQETVPTLTWVVTTRRRPSVGTVFEVPPLDVDAARALFVTRVSAVNPAVELGDFATDIVRRLDGHPLAIELAAERLRWISPRALEIALDDPTTALAGGTRGLPEHNSLVKALAMTWTALEPSDHAIAGELATFVGPFTFEAAHTVCSSTAPLLPRLEALVNAGLLRSTADRFHLLSPIREFVRAQVPCPEGCRLRHAEWFARAARPTGEGDEKSPHWTEVSRDRTELWHALAAPELPGELELRLLTLMVASALRTGPVRPTLEPLRQARQRATRPDHTLHLLCLELAVLHQLGDHDLAIALTDSHPEHLDHPTMMVMRGAHAVGRYALDEGRSWLERARAAAPDDRRVRSRCNRELGLCALRAGSPELAEGYLEEAADGYRASENPRGLALCNLLLSEVLQRRGRVRRADALCRSALAYSEDVGDTHVRGLALVGSGQCLLALGDVDGARAASDEARQLAAVTGDRLLAAHARRTAGTLALLANRLDEAREALEASLALVQEVGERRQETICQIQLGALESAVGDPTAAQRRLKRAYRFAEERDWHGLQVSAASDLALLYAQRQEWSQADEWLQRARELDDLHQTPFVSSLLAAQSAAIADTRGRTDERQRLRARAIALATEAGMLESPTFRGVLSLTDGVRSD